MATLLWMYLLAAGAFTLGFALAAALAANRRSGTEEDEHETHHP